LNISANPTTTSVEIHGNFVDGREVEAGSGAMLDVRNPSTGEVIARIPNSTQGDIDRAMKARAPPSKAGYGAAWTSAPGRDWSIGWRMHSRPTLSSSTAWRR